MIISLLLIVVDCMNPTNVDQERTFHQSLTPISLHQIPLPPRFHRETGLAPGFDLYGGASYSVPRDVLRNFFRINIVMVMTITTLKIHPRRSDGGVEISVVRV
jgi:hypothetical protein